jgi:5-methylcytosine-specific restriction endonuclease McrA
MNRWNIPSKLEQEVKERDRVCVYCGVSFGSVKDFTGCFASWEHIDNDGRNITPENIARCCRSCNSSKGTKSLAKWLESAYCQKHGISSETVADIVKNALVDPPTLN